MITPNLCSLNILLADDGSKHSQAAVHLLGDLPLDEESQIKALRVFTPSDTANVWVLEKALEITKEKLEKMGKQVESELVLGHPAEKIIEVAERHDAGMIVIGAKGLRATLGILLGGVVQQVAEHAERPVMVVRAPYAGLKRVLLTADGSEESKQMLHCMGTFPLPSGVEFEVLHIAPPIPSEQEIVQYWPSGLDVSFTVPVEEIKQQIQERAETEEIFGKRVLTEARENLAEQGIKAQIAFLRGDAATEIIQYAEDHDIDLIVSGGRGLGPIRSWILGSVSRKLLHYAPCSVMVVKNKKGDSLGYNRGYVGD